MPNKEHDVLPIITEYLLKTNPKRRKFLHNSKPLANRLTLYFRPRLINFIPRKMETKC